MKLATILLEIQKRLNDHGDTPLIDAQVLVGHLLNRSRTWVMAHPEKELTDKQLVSLYRAVERLENGEALPYLLGKWEFFGLSFNISPNVLIPRPETELLVEIALTWLRQSSNPSTLKVIDVGTGSGCIAVTLTHLVPGLHVIALDISGDALAVCQQNATLHGVNKRIHCVQANLMKPFNPSSFSFDLICANLPYIPRQTLSSLMVYRSEPALALDGGVDGLEVIRCLLHQASGCLSKQGLLLIEIEASQGVKVSDLAHDTFPQATLHLFQDLAGHDRLLSIQNCP